MIQHVHHRTDKLVKTVCAGLVTNKIKKKLNLIKIIVKLLYIIVNYDLSALKPLTL